VDSAEKPINWHAAEKYIPGRTARQISDHYANVVNQILVRGDWKKDEEQAIIKHVE
jgi:hypothetical protein